MFVEKALALSPDNPKYYISLIDICIAKSEFQTALVYLEKIVALRPRNISYLMALGEMYEKLGRVEEAKQTYFRVLEIDPLHTDVKHILKKF
ncbi:tetratricopeptide repeat protein [Patescibacteria group bacterium]|nr:tetratricopeptide repeat protein [Patescibacteria group bacterium]